jgi:ADP-dependent NAD(P)H-hydrate dehydratase
MQIITDIPKLPPRPDDSHKSLFGKVCVIAGSFGMAGAAALTGKSALRSGAGLVRIAVPKSILPTVASFDPCYTTIPLPEDSAGRISAAAIIPLLEIIKDNDVIAVGPGLGQSSELKEVLTSLIQQQNLKLVIDADGLNNLSKIKDWPQKSKANTILTPHPGEMQKLWKGLFRTELPADRQSQAVELAQKTNAIIVLKGHRTIVTDGKKVYTNTPGNPGMATAGSGDCLTGIIAALLGQKMDYFDAAVLGVYLHGLAGDIAAEKLGQVSLIATDIIQALPAAFLK